MGLDWSEIEIKMEVSAMLYKYTYFVFNFYGRTGVMYVMVLVPEFAGVIEMIDKGVPEISLFQSKDINKYLSDMTCIVKHMHKLTVLSYKVKHSMCIYKP